MGAGTVSGGGVMSILLRRPGRGILLGVPRLLLAFPLTGLALLFAFPRAVGIPFGFGWVVLITNPFRFRPAAGQRFRFEVRDVHARRVQTDVVDCFSIDSAIDADPEQAVHRPPLPLERGVPVPPLVPVPLPFQASCLRVALDEGQDLRPGGVDQPGFPIGVAVLPRLVVMPAAQLLFDVPDRAGADIDGTNAADCGRRTGFIVDRRGHILPLPRPQIMTVAQPLLHRDLRAPFIGTCHRFFHRRGVQRITMALPTSVMHRAPTLRRCRVGTPIDQTLHVSTPPVSTVCRFDRKARL